MLKLSEDLFDGIEVGAVGGQEDQMRPDGADCLARGLALVGAEVVQDDDVAFGERRDQDFPDIGCEDLAVDRSIDHPWSVDAVMA